MELVPGAGSERYRNGWVGAKWDTMPDVPTNLFTIANGLEHDAAANQDGTTHLYADIDLRWQQLPASLLLSSHYITPMPRNDP